MKCNLLRRHLDSGGKRGGGGGGGGLTSSHPDWHLRPNGPRVIWTPPPWKTPFVVFYVLHYELGLTMSLL